MRSRPLMTLRLNTAPTQNVGAGPHGTRVTFPIIGGSFEGDRLRGKVLPGGDDWTVQALGRRHRARPAHHAARPTTAPSST